MCSCHGLFVAIYYLRGEGDVGSASYNEEFFLFEKASCYVIRVRTVQSVRHQTTLSSLSFSTKLLPVIHQCCQRRRVLACISFVPYLSLLPNASVASIHRPVVSRGIAPACRRMRLRSSPPRITPEVTHVDEPGGLVRLPPRRSYLNGSTDSSCFRGSFLRMMFSTGPRSRWKPSFSSVASLTSDVLVTVAARGLSSSRASSPK